MKKHDLMVAKKIDWFLFAIVAMLMKDLLCAPFNIGCLVHPFLIQHDLIVAKKQLKKHDLIECYEIEQQMEKLKDDLPIFQYDLMVADKWRWGLRVAFEQAEHELERKKNRATADKSSIDVGSRDSYSSNGGQHSRVTRLSIPTESDQISNVEFSSYNFISRHESSSIVHVGPLPVAPVNVPKTKVPSVANQWIKGKHIGSGSFGNVYEGINRNTGAFCAMKEVTIISDDPNSLECIQQLEKEIKFLSQFKHPNIVQYYGSETIDDRFYICLEYVLPGSMNKLYVHDRFGAMKELVVRNFTRHILMGLNYLHGKRIVHRDIKGANLLVDNNGVVKLADFGMAKQLSEVASVLSLKGSSYWMAPEVLKATTNKDSSHDLCIDIWSLGCTIIEMFTGKHPWNGLEPVAAMFKVLQEDPPIPDTLSDEGKDFLQRCFRRNPADRPTANILLNHSFVQAFTGMKMIDKVINHNDRKSISESYVSGRHAFESSAHAKHHTTRYDETSEMFGRERG